MSDETSPAFGSDMSAEHLTVGMSPQERIKRLKALHKIESEPIRISVPQIDYKDFEVISGEPDLLTLYPTFAEHKWKFTAKVKDEDTSVIGERSYNGIATIPKSKITHTTAGYTYEKLMFHIEIASPTEQIVLVVDSMKLAREIHKKISDWLYL